MKKVKLLLILFISFTLTGCTVDYNLLVNDKKEVEEVIKIANSNEAILKNNESVNLYLSEQINVHKQIKLFDNYKFTKHVGKVSSYIVMERKYPSLKDYTGSPAFKNLFENATVIQNEEYTSFNTVGTYYYSNVYGEPEQPDPEFSMGDINVKIKFYNKIIDSNADKIDENNNTLEWNITSKDLEKYIYFKISNDKRYDIIVLDFIMRNKMTFIISLGLLISISLVVLLTHINFKKNNRI